MPALCQCIDPQHKCTYFGWSPYIKIDARDSPEYGKLATTLGT